MSYKNSISPELSEKFSAAWITAGGTPEQLNLLCQKPETIESLLKDLKGEPVIAIPEVLELVKTITAPPLEKGFVVVDFFNDRAVGKSGVSLQYLHPNFQEKLGGQEVEIRGENTISIHKIRQDVSILSAVKKLGVDNYTDLAFVWSLLVKQPRGGEGSLSLKEINCFYVKDKQGHPAFVLVAYENSDWGIYCLPVSDRETFEAGSLVFSKQSCI